MFSILCDGVDGVALEHPDLLTVLYMCSRLPSVAMICILTLSSGGPCLMCDISQKSEVSREDES